jgi:hypothetical protein
VGLFHCGGVLSVVRGATALAVVVWESGPRWGTALWRCGECDPWWGTALWWCGSVVPGEGLHCGGVASVVLGGGLRCGGVSGRGPWGDCTTVTLFGGESGLAWDSGDAQGCEDQWARAERGWSRPARALEWGARVTQAGVFHANTGRGRPGAGVADRGRQLGAKCTFVELHTGRVRLPDRPDLLRADRVH